MLKRRLRLVYKLKSSNELIPHTSHIRQVGNVISHGEFRWFIVVFGSSNTKWNLYQLLCLRSKTLLCSTISCLQALLWSHLFPWPLRRTFTWTKRWESSLRRLETPPWRNPLLVHSQPKTFQKRICFGSYSFFPLYSFLGIFCARCRLRDVRFWWMRRWRAYL